MADEPRKIPRPDERVEPTTSPQIPPAKKIPEPEAPTRELSPFSDPEGAGDPVPRPVYIDAILKQLSRIGAQNEALGRQNEKIVTGHEETKSGLATLDARVTTLGSDMKRDVRALADRVAEVEAELRTGKHSAAPPSAPADADWTPVEFSIPAAPPAPDTRRDVMTSGRVEEIAVHAAQKTQSDPDLQLQATVGVIAGQVSEIKGMVLSKEDVQKIAKDANKAQTDAIVTLVKDAAQTGTGRTILHYGSLVVIAALIAAAAYLQRCSGTATVGGTSGPMCLTRSRPSRASSARRAGSRIDPGASR